MKRKAHSFQPQLKVGCYHSANAEELIVRKVTVNELLIKWVPFNHGKTLTMDDTYYVKCDRNGTVLWENTQIYTSLQLVGRNNVYVVTPNHRTVVHTKV
jgi:hypothetical protein